MSKRISFTFVVSDETFRDIEASYRYRNLRGRSEFNVFVAARVVGRILEIEEDAQVLVGAQRLQLAQFEEVVRRNAAPAAAAVGAPAIPSDASAIRCIVDLAIRGEVARMQGRIDELQQAVARNEGRVVRNVRNITRLEVGANNPEMLNLPSAEEMLEVLALDNAEEI